MTPVRTQSADRWSPLPGNVAVVDNTFALNREFDTPGTIHLLMALTGKNDESDLLKHYPNFKNFRHHPQYNQLTLIQTHASVMLEERYSRAYIPREQQPFAKRLMALIEEYAMHPHRRYHIILNPLGYRLWEAERRRAVNAMHRALRGH